MNQTQLKYARSRAESIFLTRKQEITKKYTTPAVRLSDEAKLEAIEAGRFTIKDGTHGTWWYNRIKFTDEMVQKIDQKKIDDSISKLEATYQKLTDELVLGDNEQALKTLRAFEKASV